MPAVPAAGVPASVAVRSPLSVKVTPVGSAPVTVSVGTAPPPTVVTSKVPGVPTLNVVVVRAREAHGARPPAGEAIEAPPVNAGSKAK